MMTDTMQTFFLRLKDVFVNFHFIPDILDILLVALIVYTVIVQLRKTQSIQVIKGIILVAIVYGLVTFFNMSASSYIFNRLLSDIILIVVILFSGEIRQALEHMGVRSFGKKLLFLNRKTEEDELNAINAVCRACGAMSRNKVGSLILFQRETLLGDLTKQAVMIDSETTFEMLCSIFYPKAPLHDGAVIIKDGRIVAARCVVPMKNDRIINENVGTRHRAALEASLNSDCVAVVTSEETGIISIAVEGTLRRGITDSELRELLGQYLLPAANEKKPKKEKKAKSDKADINNSEEAGEDGKDE
jgi:diadenylate cyclase